MINYTIQDYERELEALKNAPPGAYEMYRDTAWLYQGMGLFEYGEIPGVVSTKLFGVSPPPENEYNLFVKLYWWHSVKPWCIDEAYPGELDTYLDTCALEFVIRNRPENKSTFLVSPYDDESSSSDDDDEIIIPNAESTPLAGTFKSIEGNYMEPFYPVVVSDSMVVVVTQSNIEEVSVEGLKKRYPCTEYFNVNADGPTITMLREYATIPLRGRSKCEKDPSYIQEALTMDLPCTYKGDDDFVDYVYSDNISQMETHFYRHRNNVMVVTDRQGRWTTPSTNVNSGVVITFVPSRGQITYDDSLKEAQFGFVPKGYPILRTQAGACDMIIRVVRVKNKQLNCLDPREVVSDDSSLEDFGITLSSIEPSEFVYPVEKRGLLLQLTSSLQAIVERRGMSKEETLEFVSGIVTNWIIFRIIQMQLWINMSKNWQERMEVCWRVKLSLIMEAVAMFDYLLPDTLVL
jgi:hypothetical protein